MRTNGAKASGAEREIAERLRADRGGPCTLFRASGERRLCQGRVVIEMSPSTVQRFGHRATGRGENVPKVAHGAFLFTLIIRATITLIIGVNDLQGRMTCERARG